ncbi:unnamed protein product [Paramecium sonneborni]|nr:unnamed protein product [Paramecium sonneborni]
MINPNNFEAQGLLAQSLFKQGKFMESYIILDQMINQFNDIDEFDMMMKQKRLTSFLNFFQDNKHQDEHLIEDAKEILERDPQSFMANFILSDYKLWIDNVEMLYKKYPNNKCFQWSYFYFLLQQENYKGIIKLNTQSIFPLFIIAPYLQDEIRDNMDDKNTIEYLDKLNPNEPQNRLFEIIKSIILIETGNQQESFEQLQKILSFDEVIREYVLTVLFYKMEIFKIFINRFLETKTKRQIEQMIKQKLDIDPENLAVWFLNTYVKLYE